MSRSSSEISAIDLVPALPRIQSPPDIPAQAGCASRPNPGRRLHPLVLAGALALTFGLGGCATLGLQEPPPVTVPEIVSMSQQGVADYRIINRMRKSGTVYRLKASQLADLREKGVSDHVLNYMQRTYLEAVRRRQELEDWDNWSEVDGWWYGGDAWGWPDAWSPYRR